MTYEQYQIAKEIIGQIDAKKFDKGLLEKALTDDSLRININNSKLPVSTYYIAIGIKAQIEEIDRHVEGFEKELAAL